MRTEVDSMISVLHLEDKRDTAAKDLSGGMKRKLCVGIALIAGSKVSTDSCHSLPRHKSVTTAIALPGQKFSIISNVESPILIFLSFISPVSCDACIGANGARLIFLPLFSTAFFIVYILSCKL